MAASLTERQGDAHPDLSGLSRTAREGVMCVCVSEWVRKGERERGVGVALGVLMTQFPLRGGPPICEQNRWDLAKKKERKKEERVNEKSYMGQGGDIEAWQQMENNFQGNMKYFHVFHEIILGLIWGH